MVPAASPKAASQLSNTAETACFWAAVALSGGAVMVVEILGARVVGPVFGVGLFVWSALIGVTLGALALGYYLGGKLVDRRPHVRLLYLVMATSGIWIALSPLLSKPVLLATAGLGLRLGPLVAATALYGPVLVLLGSVSPIAVRVRSTSMESVGRTAGLLYAVSTLSGVVAALLTGFYLAPYVAISTCWFGLAACMLALSALGLLQVTGQTASALLPLVSLAAWADIDVPLGKGIEIIAEAQSPYARLAVIEDTSRAAGAPLRLLRADHSFIGAKWMHTGEPGFAFFHIIESLVALRPAGEELLLLGLGVGSVPEAMSKRGIRVDSVEIDSEVVRLATQHFGFVPPGPVYVEDARTFVQRTDKRYDFIVQDTFTGGSNPEHLLTLEMFQSAKRALRDRGVLVVNIVAGDEEPGAALAHSVKATLRAAFEHVRVFREAGRETDVPILNLLYFASDAPLDFSGVRQLSCETPTCEHVLTNFEAWETLKDSPADTSPLTDERNQTARLALPIGERFHALMNEMYPPEFWVN